MKFIVVLMLALSLMARSFASPGAHGPNGEHLDQPGGASPAGSVPTLETFTETFELVGTLSGGEFSVMVDRYETNEPVLNGKLEVEYKGIKALAKFHADMGDYAIDDARMLAALAAPGKHALVFTFIAGDESDLLEGTLDVAQEENDHDHEHGMGWKQGLLATLAATALLALALFIRRNRMRKAAP